MSSDKLIAKILRDIRVDLKDQFDQNFERQGFFSEAWKRRKSPLRGDGHILLDTGDLRRSISTRSDADSVVFYSTLPYASIHNEGGEIKVTARMKRFFWAKYYEACGGFKRKKDGSLSKGKTTVRLTTEAEFWKFMALMKEGKTIKIPRRRFLGESPEVESHVNKVIVDNIAQYIASVINNLEKG